MVFFQVFSRNNDVNGNPYRLILRYDEAGSILSVSEARSSSPNEVTRLRKAGEVQLITVHVAPAEYQDLKRWGDARHVS